MIGPFSDRREAGRFLARKLGHLARTNLLVLALPRGGVPVGFEVAKALDAPLDVLLVRKLGVPWQPELALGAVIDGDEPCMVLNESVIRAAGISRRTVAEIAGSERTEIERRRRLWLPDRPSVEIAGRTVIIVDDGVATGASVRAGLEAVRKQRAARIIIAMPVAPADVAEALRHECDEAVFLATPRDFTALGLFYADFRQLEDSEVRDLLRLAAM